MPDGIEATGKFMELIDKLDGFKRYMLIWPVMLCFVGVITAMVQQGKTVEALTAVTAVLGPLVGYYFGVNNK